MNSRVLAAGLILASLVICALLAPKTSAQDTRPNIILFIGDDLGWQDVALPFADQETELNRRYRTPNLIKMAAEGMKFTNAYAAGPVCSPTRVALMTGRTPLETHVTAALGAKDTERPLTWPGQQPPLWNLNGLSPVAGFPRSFTGPTLPSLLRNAGYRTIHVGKGHWGAVGTPGADPLALGFDVNIGGSGAGAPSNYQGMFNFAAGPSASAEAHMTDVPGLEAYHRTNTFLTEALTIEANKAIDRAVAERKPFFLHFAHFAPHTPLNADLRFADSYRSLGGNEIPYAALIEGLDKSLGDIIANVERHRLGSSTLIVFMSDNGASPEARSRPPDRYNAPLRNHKGSGYEGGLRVPLVVRWPGRIKAGTSNSTPVITDDWFPTVLSLANVPDRERHTSGIRARDLAGMLEGRQTLDPERSLLWHYPHSAGASNQRTASAANEAFSAIRQGPWKLIFFYGNRRYELYNLEKDLSESRNVLTDNQAIATRLSRQLRDELTKTGAKLPLDAATKREIELPPPISK